MLRKFCPNDQTQLKVADFSCYFNTSSCYVRGLHVNGTRKKTNYNYFQYQIQNK